MCVCENVCEFMRTGKYIRREFGQNSGSLTRENDRILLSKTVVNEGCPRRQCSLLVRKCNYEMLHVAVVRNSRTDNNVMLYESFVQKRSHVSTPFNFQRRNSVSFNRKTKSTLSMHLKHRKSSCHLSASYGRRLCHFPRTGLRFIYLPGKLCHSGGNLGIKEMAFPQAR